jgi:hypothetical protein
MSKWNYIPFKEGTWGSVKIHSEDNMQYLSEVDGEYHWMGTGPSFLYGVLGQRLMFHKAKGKVLTTLGLGLLPLLMATKDEVTEVVCYELSQDIIDAWDAQDFDKSKITVIHGDVMKINNIESYDSICLDCAPVQWQFKDKWLDKLKDHNFIPQAWEEQYVNFLSKNYDGEHCLEAINQFCDEMYMQRLSIEDADSALYDYYAKFQKYRYRLVEERGMVDWPIDETINQQLLKIRKTNG